MFSKSTLKYFNKKQLKKYNSYKKYPSFKKYFEMVKKGDVPRPHYALGLLMAAHQAKHFNIKKISVIEFGCWNLEGLIDLEQHSVEISKIIDVEFQIYGFTLKEGLPNYKFNKFDRYNEWKQGDFKFSAHRNLKKLKKSKVIFGDVKKTIKPFIKRTNFLSAPIGFIINDLDYYTSTMNSFKILEMSNKNYLPKPVLYFDDFFRSNKFEGEYKAINDYNNKSKKKIATILEFAEQLSLSWQKWIFLGKRFKYLIDFNNPKYHKFYNDIFP